MFYKQYITHEQFCQLSISTYFADMLKLIYCIYNKNGEMKPVKVISPLFFGGILKFIPLLFFLSL